MYIHIMVNYHMTWEIKEGCFGCGRCSFCSGIAMENHIATIVDQDSDCIESMSQICPAGIIQQA